jgi:hypothetical protein
MIIQGRYWAPLPLMATGAACVAAAALALQLPETSCRPMPQTVSDAEALIIDTSLWRWVCMMVMAVNVSVVFFCMPCLIFNPLSAADVYIRQILQFPKRLQSMSFIFLVVLTL